MIRIRFILFLLAAFLGWLPCARASLPAPRDGLTATRPAVQAAETATVWELVDVQPHGHTDDGTPLALFVFVEVPGPFDMFAPVSTRAGPKTHTRVLYGVQPVLGLESEWFAGDMGVGVIWGSRFHDSRELFTDIGTDFVGTPLRLGREAILYTGHMINDGVDLSLDSLTTVAGGTKDLGLAFASLPLVAVERGLGFREFDTFGSYLVKHVKTPIEFGFSQRWHALRRVGTFDSSTYFIQEIPLVGNFVPNLRGNMSGPEWVANSGGINAGSMSAARLRESGTRDHMIINNVTYPQVIAPYDRGTATEVGLAMFFGYKSRGLEWASQIVNQVPEGSTIRSIGHSGGVIRSSIGSNYIAAYNIGVSRQFSEQGPAVGFFNNIESMRAVFSIGLRDPTSDLGAILSPLYWTRDREMTLRFSNKPHIQGGFGSEWDTLRIKYIK